MFIYIQCFDNKVTVTYKRSIDEIYNTGNVLLNIVLDLNYNRKQSLLPL